MFMSSLSKKVSKQRVFKDEKTKKNIILISFLYYFFVVVVVGCRNLLVNFHAFHKVK